MGCIKLFQRYLFYKISDRKYWSEHGATIIKVNYLSSKQKLQTWKQKTPDEKFKIRNQFERFHNLPEKEKQTLRDTYGAFKSLSLDEQRSLLIQHSKKAG